MQFLADESCDFAAGRALREAGHDVIAVAETFPRAEDSSVLARALQERRILLTEDKDFGRLVYSSSQASAGVLLFRFPARSRGALAKAAADLVRQKGNQLSGRFVVVQPGRVRVGAFPEG